ncbi:MAG TPA: CHRD domain-containing protein [Azonexus sp.]|nr:CHRD domain-containing protein [Azonexus sp.]
MRYPSNLPRSLLRRFSPLALLLLASASAHAQQALSLSLNGATEVPPVVTAATASGQISVTPDRNISGSIKVSGLVATMAHIHEAAAGKNGPPIITLIKAPNDSFAVPAGTRLSDAQYSSYTSGMLYVNVHSAQHPDGEIRAQLHSTPQRLAN